MHQLTGSSVWGGAASLVIGVLLLTIAFVLARACEALLIGKQADPELVRQLEKTLEEQEEIDDVVGLLTMMTGTRRVLVCARVDFVYTISAGELEQACVRIDEQLRADFSELDEIFIQPMSRTDQRMRDRVRRRYRHALAEKTHE